MKFPRDGKAPPPRAISLEPKTGLTVNAMDFVSDATSSRNSFATATGADRRSARGKSSAERLRTDRYEIMDSSSATSYLELMSAGDDAAP